MTRPLLRPLLLAGAVALAASTAAAAPVLHGTGDAPPTMAGALFQLAQQESLSQIQENALKDGCKIRYEGDSKKHKRCLNQEANWQDALAQGCTHRYQGNTKKLRECMDY